MTAIDLSVRFEPDRKLPEKAIELVDKAAERMSPPLPLRPARARRRPRSSRR